MQHHGSQLRILACLCALAIAVALSGCGVSRSSYGDYTAGAAVTDNVVGMDRYSFDGAYAEEAYDDYAYEMAMPETEAKSNLSSNAGSSMVTAPNSPTTKVIYTASVSIETLDFAQTVQDLAEMTKRLGGYYEEADLDDTGNYRTANYTIRIPVAQYTAFLEETGTLGHVLRQVESAQDISERYYDTAGRLATQQNKLERLQELLLEAEDMADIITIESEISYTEQEIDSLSGALRKYDSLVEFSTIDLFVREVYEVTEEATPPVTFRERLSESYKDGIDSLKDSAESFVIAIAYAWTRLLIIAVIVVIVLLATKKSRADARERRRERASHATNAGPNQYSRPGMIAAEQKTETQSAQTEEPAANQKES